MKARTQQRFAPAIVAAGFAAVASVAAIAAPAKSNELAEWDAKWTQIQSDADRTDWIDHFRVCAIKFRYRNYDQLFRCLTLFEAKIARDGIKVKHGNIGMLRKAAPVLTGWLRAAAYTELGEPEQALQWAQSAWDALPEEFRQTKQSWMGGQVQDEFSGVALAIGGYSMRDDEATFFGKDNPAGLDLRGETIAMGLAAQRALLHARAGDTDKARIALADLQKWEGIRLKDNWIGIFPTAAPFKIQSQLLSLGPLFALGDYAQVVRIYDEAAAETARKKHRHQLRMALTWIVFLPQGLTYALENQITKAFTAADARPFARAIPRSRSRWRRTTT